MGKKWSAEETDKFMDKAIGELSEQLEIAEKFLESFTNRRNLAEVNNRSKS